MKKFQFTLVELLVVIAIIMILAGLTLPALSHARNRAREVQAMADINAIKTAIVSANNTYGKMFPSDGKFTKYTYSSTDNAFTGATGGSFILSSTNGYFKLGGSKGSDLSSPGDDPYACYVYELMNLANTGGTTVLYNTRRVRFLDPPGNFDQDPKKMWLDPWGRQYVILIYDYNDSAADANNPKIKVEDKDKQKNLFGDLFIYSCGTDGKDYADSGTSDEKRAFVQDNVQSWEKK